MQKLFTYLLRIALLLLAASCMQCSSSTDAEQVNKTPQTAMEWIEASINYHDPKEVWPVYNVVIENRAILAGPDAKPRESKLLLNNALGTFSSIAQAQEYSLTHVRTPDTTYTHWGHPSPTVEDSSRYGLDGSRVARIYNYHRYLQGLPMVLKDEGTLVQDSVFTQEIEGTPHTVVTVDYLPEGQEPTWQFYIRQSDFALSQTRFYRYRADRDTTTGEFIKFRDDTLVQGVHRYQTFIWEYLDEKPLATDVYRFVEE